MKTIGKISILIFLFFCLFCSSQTNAQQLRKVQNTSFQRGEKIVYRVFYDSWMLGNVTAGEASLEIMEDNAVIAGRNTMHVVGIGKTRGIFNLFFKVVNRYETYIDEEAIAPLVFIRRINEGGYVKNQDVLFNHYTNKAVSNTATVDIAPYVQDIISAFYYARTYDFSNAKIGDEYDVTFFLDDSVYVSKIIYDGKEVVSNRMGTFNTLRFKPMVLAGTVFSQPYPMTLWISDDKNKIPIMLQSGIIVGTVKMELINYSGLKSPLTSKIK
jgi:hypothetical protein